MSSSQEALGTMVADKEIVPQNPDSGAACG
jgi:hypothetical protein